MITGRTSNSTINRFRWLPSAQDELRYYYRHAIFQETTRETLTFRNSVSIRKMSSFLPGTGVGGAGIHWNGTTSCRRISWYAATTRNVIPESMTIQDWGGPLHFLEGHLGRGIQVEDQAVRPAQSVDARPPAMNFKRTHLNKRDQALHILDHEMGLLRICGSANHQEINVCHKALVRCAGR
jgi:hypothetical protein